MQVNGYTMVLGAVSAATIIVTFAFLVRRFKPASFDLNLGDPKRFARLLIAEIRMYHGKAVVDRAWGNSAIYATLKDDIDRSRQMFLKRCPASQQAFYDALVEVLARGQEERLGADYSYPRTPSRVAAPE